MSPDEFASALSESALAAAKISEEFELSLEDGETLKDRVYRIFSSDRVLQVNTKAIAVMTDHDNLFLNAKILTDARPVFNDDGSKLEAMAIVHMLRIHVEHNQKHEDFFTALDSADLKNLRRVIDRAERKAQILQQVFKTSNVVYLDVEQSNANE